MSAEVNTIPGQLPKGADTNVIFFANILALFFGNTDETDVLQEEVGALATYGSRLIPILNLMYRGGDNLLVLEREPTDVLLNYFKNQLGLLLPSLSVMSHKDYLTCQNSPSQLSSDLRKTLKIYTNHQAQRVDGYVTDDILVAISQYIQKKTVSTAKGSRRGNNKLLLHKYFQEKNLPVFDTHIASNADEAIMCLKKLHKSGYQKAVVKAQVGASGIGMRKVNLSDGVDEFPEYIFYEGPCLVQGWLDESYKNVKYIGSPSVQMFLTEDDINLFDLTEQFLSLDSVHEGNISSPVYLENDKASEEELLSQAQLAGQWLYNQGYRGAASCDFHVSDNAGKREVRICEINARVTGATYPSLLSRHFMPMGMWLMRNIRFAPPINDGVLMKGLKESGLLYQPGEEQGVLPFNFNSNKEGGIIKAQFLFLGKTREDIYHLLEAIIQSPNIQGSYDRD